MAEEDISAWSHRQWRVRVFGIHEGGMVDRFNRQNGHEWVTVGMTLSSVRSPCYVFSGKSRYCYIIWSCWLGELLASQCVVFDVANCLRAWWLAAIPLVEPMYMQTSQTAASKTSRTNVIRLPLASRLAQGRTAQHRSSTAALSRLAFRLPIARERCSRTAGGWGSRIRFTWCQRVFECTFSSFCVLRF